MAVNSNDDLLDHIQQVWEKAECIYDAVTVQRRIDQLAFELTETYSDLNPVLLCLMKGALVFAGELITKLPFPLEFDYIHASRYGDQLQGEDLNWTHRPSTQMIQNRHVLLLDDIFDQGATVEACRRWALSIGALSAEAVVLAEKKHDRQLTDFRPKYKGLEVPDVFVVGYGMDYRDYFRNANGIFSIDPEGIV